MANKESFIFDVNADITKAMQGLDKVKQSLDDIDRLRKKGESRGKTTTDNDILNSMRHAKQAAKEYKKLQDMLKGLDKSLKGSNQRMFNNNDSDKMKSMTGVDMKTKQDYQKYIKDQRRALDVNYTKIKNAQREMARFGQTHTKNFQTNYNQKGIMHVDTKNLDEAKKTVKGILTDINASSGQLDSVLKQIREAKKLDSRSESLARRQSASGFMSYQQASTFKKDYNTVNTTYKTNKEANLTRLTQISTDLTNFAKKINEIESNPNATTKDMEQRAGLQNNIRALDKEWQARTKLNKVLEATTANVQGHHESLVGTKQKADRNTIPGMVSERAPAIGLAITGAIAASIGKLYSQGSGLSKEMRGNEVYIGQQTGMDGSNWRTGIRNNAMKSGLKNRLGFDGTEMLGFQENYLTARGNTGRADLESAMMGQATFSRATGINSQDTQQFFDTAYRSGGVTGGQTKQFQNSFLGAIKQSGMEGREKDQLKALDGILQGMTQGRSITNNEMMQTMGLQSVLSGTGVSALGGTKGGQMLSSLDAGIRKGFDDPSVRVAFGQGTKYQGVEGRWQLRQQMEKGISDVDNVNTIAGIAKQFGGGDKEKEYEAFMSFTKDRLGVDISTQQAKGLMDEYNKGTLTKENLSKVIENNQSEGEKESKKRQSNYEKSSAATDSQSEAVTAKQAVGINDMGQAVRSANAALGGLPAPVYGAIVAVGAFTAAMLGAAASFGLAGLIKNRSMGTYGGGGGGVTPGGGAGRPPSGGVGTGAGANIPPGHTMSPGGVIVPGSPTPTTPHIPGGEARQYAAPGQGGAGNWFKGLFDPSARAGGLANFGTGEAIAGGAAVAGGAAAAANSGGFSNLFKGGLKDSVAFKGLNKLLLPLAAFSAYSTISSASSEDKGKATGSAVGGIGGGILGGAAAGAAAGSIIPGAGTLVGGAIGLTGGIIGSIFGSNIGENIGGWFDPDKGKDKNVAPESPKASPSSETPAATNTSTSGATPMATSMGYTAADQMPTNMPNTGGNTNSTKELVDKENTNTKQRTEMKKTDNLSYERENLTFYEKVLQKAEALLAQARAQNGIMGSAQGGGSGGGANGINGFTGGGSLKFLSDGQKWSNNTLTQHDLGTTDAKLTAEDLDAWINSKAPEGSMMRGMGSTFLKAGQENGLDPRYLIAHAAEESAWGTSRIAKDKGNFFGIGAFDDSPYGSAYEFKDGTGTAAEKGIMGGAKWIAEKYYGKGRTTLDAMHKAGYATNGDWSSNIASIMGGAPTGTGSGNMTATINVNVKGDEKVSDKVKNSSDMKKVGKDISDMLGFYSKEMVMA